MNFDLTVYACEFPENLSRTWQEALSDHGLLVQAFPGFSPATWRGGFLPFKLSVKQGAFPATSRYGNEPLLAGFEIDFATAAPDEIESIAVEASPQAAALVRKSSRSASFRSGTGRTVADLRLQCYAAATLAQISGGVVFDWQQRQISIGKAIIANAARDAAAFEENPVDPADWNLNPFPGWDALEPPA